jgi:hypothetical protein
MVLMGVLQSLVKLANEVGLPNEDLNVIFEHVISHCGAFASSNVKKTV